LKEEVREPVNYFSIIRTLAAGNHKIGNIASLLELPPTKLIPYMRTLIDLGFIEKRLPVTEKNAEKSRKGLYFISDNFMRFWFKYVYPFRGELELDNMEIVFEQLEKDFVSSFTTLAYEDICKDIFAKLCATKKILFTPSVIGSYWQNDIHNQDTQIDVMAVDNSHKIVFAGECKYRAKEVDADVYFGLKAKVERTTALKEAFPEYKYIFGIFSKSGFTQRLHDIAAQHDASIQNKTLYLINEAGLCPRRLSATK
jgi:AAA+ ATPase superfamily predicted ATPase